MPADPERPGQREVRHTLSEPRCVVCVKPRSFALHGTGEGQHRFDNIGPSLRVLVVPVAGPVQVRTVRRDADVFRDLIGAGWLESLASVAGTWSCWIDEDRERKALPVNPRATELAVMNGWQRRPAEFISGDAFFAGPPNADGESTQLPLFLIARARAAFGIEVIPEIDSTDAPT